MYITIIIIIYIDLVSVISSNIPCLHQYKYNNYINLIVRRSNLCFRFKPDRTSTKITNYIKYTTCVSSYRIRLKINNFFWLLDSSISCVKYTRRWTASRCKYKVCSTCCTFITLLWNTGVWLTVYITEWKWLNTYQ